MLLHYSTKVAVCLRNTAQYYRKVAKLKADFDLKGRPKGWSTIALSYCHFRESQTHRGKVPYLRSFKILQLRSTIRTPFYIASECIRVIEWEEENEKQKKVSVNSNYYMWFSRCDVRLVLSYSMIFYSILIHFFKMLHMTEYIEFMSQIQKLPFLHPR